jgi:Flp pilus assembly protein TadD
LEKTLDRQVQTKSKTRIVEQVKTCLHLGEYSHALDLLRGAADPNDTELSELARLAQDGLRRNAEAQRLITESQELFAQQKSAEAIQVLRKAYELDKHNSLARSILANALVEHAHTIVESDWLEAEKVTNQALNLNPAHPTAKTILNRIVEQKEKSSVDDWVSQARKLQSSGDIFAALAWVAEGLAVHPHDPKLLQIQDAIQRDQEARRRQDRRGDLEELRRLQREIDGAADVAAKQALATRIQAIAAKYWTDGEILSIANALLLRLGLIHQESSSASPRSKGATVILHVPRPAAATPSSAAASPALATSNPATTAPPSPLPSSPVQSSLIQANLVPSSPPASSQGLPSLVPPSPALQGPDASAVPANLISPSPASSENFPAATIAPSEVLSNRIPLRTAPRGKARSTPREPAAQRQAVQPEALTVPTDEPSTTATTFPSSFQPKQAAKSNSTSLIIISAAFVGAIILVATISFFAGKHDAQPAIRTQQAGPAVPTPAASTPTASATVVSAPLQASPESQPDLRSSSATAAGKVATHDHLPNDQVAENLRSAAAKPASTLSTKSDPPQQATHIRKGEEAKLISNLQPQPQPQPQPRVASLTIQGGTPGTTVLVDQTPVGTIQPDGTLSVSTVNPGDHTVELRKERFKPRQLKQHFIAGGTISLAAADAAMEAVPGELTINFAPADAKVAIVKGELLKLVTSGVPLNLAAGTYTLTARTADRFTRSSTVEVVPGQSKTLNVSLAPNGMSKWDDPGAWKPDKDSFLRKGGDFVLYGVTPVSGTFVFSAMPGKGHLLQWVFNYIDPKNYVLFQMDDTTFYRAVILNGEKTDEIKVAEKSDKKSFRALQIRVSPTEIVHQIKHGESWIVLDRWTRPGIDQSHGRFGFYIPGNDEVELSAFTHYADLNIH